jgi:hypothetical protein
MSGTSTPVLFNLTNLQAPASGITHTIKVIVFCSSASPVSNFSPQNYVNSFGSFVAQSMRVDNSANAIGVTISEEIVGWSQYVPAGETLTFNFPAIQDPLFGFSSDGGSVTFNVLLFDFPAFSFTSSNPNNASGTPISAPGDAPVPVSIAGGTITQAAPYSDASVESTGASQQLVSANGARKYLLIGAPTTAPVWVNFSGGSAGVGLTGCFQISAGGFYESNLVVPSNAVNVFCVDAGLIIPCTEG